MKRKLHYSLYISLKNSQGGIYRHQGKGGQGATSGPRRWRGRASTAMETRPELRFCGCTGETRAAPPEVRYRVGPLSAACPDFCFWAFGFDRITLLGQ